MVSQHSTTADFSSRYKFNGKELDKETGWYYYGARYYDPQVSTWLSVDPLAEKYAGFSPYNFTLGNPVILIDPNGMGVDKKDWKPKVNKNGSVSYIKEKGDNAETFAKQYGLTETEANQIVPDNIKEGEAISGLKVKMLTNDHNEILKLDLSSHNDELTDSDIIHQAVFAIRYDFIQDSKLSENGTVPDWSLNLKSYYKGVSNYVDRHAGGTFYGIDTKKTNITLGGQIFKDVKMNFSGATNGLLDNNIADWKHFGNRTEILMYHPKAYEIQKKGAFNSLSFTVNTNDYEKFVKYLNP